jgi:hypothetical protein
MRVIDMECSVPKGEAAGAAPAETVSGERPAGYGMANYGRIFRSRAEGGDPRPRTDVDEFVARR